MPPCGGDSRHAQPTFGEVQAATESYVPPLKSGWRVAHYYKFDEEKIPRVGLEFQNEDDVIEFYKAYAKEVGFGIRKGKAEHNHVLSSPRKVVLHPCHRKLTSAQANQIEMASHSGIPPKSSFKLMVRQVGGRENLGFIPVDYKNYNLCNWRIRSGNEIEEDNTGEDQGIMLL
ncbi:hypothetical protein LIER_39093 [Lithospermum erythrorhizon]|uniref:Protein FAR1-RELATED SEQUENCE n=1 Tax=Lithospermum erythrorhizon TaxID=34254 RepID=A0AAV3QDX0_LITER